MKKNLITIFLQREVFTIDHPREVRLAAVMTDDVYFYFTKDILKNFF